MILHAETLPYLNRDQFRSSEVFLSRRIFSSSAKNFENPLSLINFRNKQINLRRSWLKVVLINFFIAGCMGLLLRLAHVTELPWMDFRSMMHGHSHTAMLGWLFLVLYAIILDHFLPAEEVRNKKYDILFWITQVTVVGMMISFPIEGYGAVSITFSTLQLLTSYVIAGVVLPKIWKSPTASGLLLRTAFILMLISTIGVWLIGPISTGLFGDSVLYYASIQFFLHFQFNGWFTFAVMALVFQQIEMTGGIVSKQRFGWFYGLLLISTALTYALSVAWSTPEDWIFYLNSAGVLIQLIALVVFWQIVKKHSIVFFHSATTLTKALLILAFVSFGGKILIQTAVVIPQIAVISYTIRQFVVGFIHLTMLGSITCYVLASLTARGILDQKTNLIRWGLISILIGFISTELLLFLQGLWLWIGWGFFPAYYEIVFAATVFLPLGIVILLSGTFVRQKQYVPFLTYRSTRKYIFTDQDNTN